MSLKTNIATLLFFILSSCLHSQWDTAFYQHEDYRIDDVWIFDNDNFLIAGDFQGSGHIYSTDDGGESYYVYTFDNWIRRLFFINDSIGFAGGTDNYGIYKTYDKGRTWRLIESETFFMDIHYMYFFSEKIGFVEHKWTYDGGLTWNMGEFYIHDVLRVSDSVAYACYHWSDYGIAKTRDNGLTWDIIHDSLSVRDLIGVGGGHNIALLSDGAILHSYDLFQSFEDTTYVQGYTGNQVYIDFADSLNGIMATFSSSYTIPKMKIFVTQDGGYTWFYTDIIYGRIWEYDNSPVHCLHDQTFINTYNTLLKSQKGNIGPVDEIKPIKPRSSSGFVIPAQEARNIDLQSDSSGNIYVACTFQGQLEIGDTIINHPWKGSLLYAKLDRYFNIIWLHTFASADYFNLPFNLVVFPDGKSVIHLNLSGDYYLDSEGPISGGRGLFHHNVNGEIIDMIQIDGYFSDQCMEGDNISKVFLGGHYSGTLSIGNDSINSDKGNFLFIWDVEANCYTLVTIAEHYKLFFNYSNIKIGYDPGDHAIYYSANYKDSVLIDGQYYFAHHQGMHFNLWPSYYLLSITPEGLITDVDPNFCAIRSRLGGNFNDYFFLGNGESAILGIHDDSLFYDHLYYPPEPGDRSFYISVNNMGASSDVNYLGGKPWGIQAYQAISYKDYVIFNAHQNYKTQFGNEMIYNAGNIYREDNVFLFYDSEMNYVGNYQIVDQYYNTDLEVINDIIYLGGSSYDNAIEFENEVFYNNGESFYYITELDFQYLYMEEPAEAIINPLKIFPNPSHGRFMIEIPEGCKNGSLNVYSLNGQLLHSSDFSNEREIEVFLDESPGVYLIKLSSGKSIYTEKLIISR